MAAAVVGVSAAALVLSVGGRVDTPAVAPVAAPAVVAPAPGREALATSISALQAQLARGPTALGYAALGAAYVQQARVTSDPSAYARAQQALDRSLQLQPRRNGDAETGLGALAAGRHDFSAALAHADAALAINSFSASATGVRVDALTELGRYDESEAAAQRMLDLRPDVASLTRASYQLELRGRLDQARSALERALQAAPSPSDVAFCEYYLGELAWNAGQTDVAAQHYDAARTADQTSLPAQQGQAKVAWARGDGDSAARDYAQVVSALPSPSYLIEQVDLLQSLGRGAEAVQQASLLDAEVALFRANGASVDLELSLYLADHGRGPEALTAAEAEYGRRKSVVVADAYAWALHSVGRDTEALQRATEAARLGGRSALALFHRGMIEQSLGRRGPAAADLRAALATNPHFSPLQAAAAKTALAQLG